MQTAVSIIALVLSIASLSWQAATFVMSGGRVKAELLVGAMNAAGAIVTVQPHNRTDRWAQSMAEQGFARPVVAIQVHNTGRMPVTIERWGVSVLEVTHPSGLLMKVAIQAASKQTPLVTLWQVTDHVSGPELPHSMEAGGRRVLWAMDSETVADFVAATKAAFTQRVYPIVGKVELGNGRIYVTSTQMRG